MPIFTTLIHQELSATTPAEMSTMPPAKEPTQLSFLRLKLLSQSSSELWTGLLSDFFLYMVSSRDLLAYRTWMLPHSTSSCRVPYVLQTCIHMTAGTYYSKTLQQPQPEAPGSHPRLYAGQQLEDTECLGSWCASQPHSTTSCIRLTRRATESLASSLNNRS